MTFQVVSGRTAVTRCASARAVRGTGLKSARAAAWRRVSKSWPTAVRKERANGSLTQAASFRGRGPSGPSAT